MNIVKRMITLASDLLLVFLALSTLAVVLGFGINLLVSSVHGHGTIHDAAIGFSFALHMFIWLLPLTALTFFVSALMGIQIPVDNRE